MMSPELTALRDEALQTSCESWALRRRWKLGPGIDRAGPCPNCGGTDRFAIHTKKNTFNCRKCGITGHGVIDLVMKTESVEFVPACEIITGRQASAPIDEQRMADLRRQNDELERKRAAEAASYRENARRKAHDVWRNAAPVTVGGPVDRYLKLRGIDLDDVVTRQGHHVKIYEILELPWRERVGDKTVTKHVGPAMIAAVTRPDGHFGAIHQTWLDIAQPKGKLVLPPDDAGKERPAKKVLGVKKGGAIRLYTPPAEEKPGRIVMGEGIETTLTALAHAFEPKTAYWAGVDLGNMSGKAAKDPDGHWLYDEPDMADDDCFLPPDWCEELVYLTDSDDAATHTVGRVTRGLRRALALRPNLKTAFAVPPIGDGKDLNDLVRAG